MKVACTGRITQTRGSGNRKISVSKTIDTTKEDSNPREELLEFISELTSEMKKAGINIHLRTADITEFFDNE